MNFAFIKPIRTEEEYESATERMAELVSAPIGSEERCEMDLLYDLVEHYEDRHHNVDPPSPHEAIRFRMEQADLSLDKVATVLGSKICANELIRGKRPPTVEEVSLLNQKLGIPLESLLSRGVYRRKRTIRKIVTPKPFSAAIEKKIRLGINQGMSESELIKLVNLEPRLAKAVIKSVAGPLGRRAHSTSEKSSHKPR